jgi:enoyl-CoA hydratase/carnithine racemase
MAPIRVTRSDHGCHQNEVGVASLAVPDDSSLVHLERHDDGVAVVTLDHPKVNALSTALLGALEAVALELTAEPPGAVVVTGGERLFAAGADITEFTGDGGAGDDGPTADPGNAAVVGGAFDRALRAVAAIPRVTIASVSGFALGGGCELALACDLRIGSTKATFGQPEVLLGIIPGGGGTQRLARLVGPARAKDVILSGRQVKAEEALAIGLLDEVVEPEALQARAHERAAAFAAGPVAVHALAKRAIDDGLEGSLDAGLALEQELFVESFRTEDATIGIRSYLEHGPGKAVFTGR